MPFGMTRHELIITKKRRFPCAFIFINRERHACRGDSLFSVCQHTHEACALDGVLEHLLVLQAQAGVVTLSDISEVVSVWLESWVVLVIHVGNSDAVERTNLLLHALVLLLIVEWLW